MCGIAGIFAYKSGSPPVDRVELLRVRETMFARGPDGAGLWISLDGKVGLANRRLAIIDLSPAGDQPMFTADGSLSVVFNGEIYNYQALRASLEQKGYLFRSNSDTEILLHLYSDKSVEMVQDLRGMYAFALWDSRKRGLFLARDPLGIKPLYYTDDSHSFRFASQVKALLKGGNIDISPEPAGHVGFFLLGYVPEPYTLYKGIRSLPAGSALWVDESGRSSSIRTFYNVSEELRDDKEAMREISREEVQAQLRAALVDSVGHHLVADVPVGVFLSSGLDSTTITALASKIAPENLRTITLGFQEYRGTLTDETLLADRVGEMYRSIHQTHWISREDFSTHLSSIMEAMDQPSIDGINTYFVSRAAAESGLKVALSGLGGDELFAGYPSFKDMPRIVRAAALMRGFPAIGKAFRVVFTPVLKNRTSTKYAGLFEYGHSYGGAYLLRRGLYMPWELPEILDGEMVREGWKELQLLTRLKQTVRRINVERQKVAALELKWYMRNQLLRDSDWAGMAHSIEIRVPFVDIGLLRMLRPLLNSDHPPSKLDMARTAVPPLPKEVLKRPKTGFGIPVREWSEKAVTGYPNERGLRGWARSVYAHFTGQ